MTIYWPAYYEWAFAARFVEPLRLGMSHHFPIETRPIAQPYTGIVNFQVALDGTVYDVAIDYGDYVEHIDRECLSRAALYFKMQCLRRGYSVRGAEKILPGGYIMGHEMGYDIARPIRDRWEHKQPVYDVYGRFGVDFSKDIRSAAVRMLAQQSGFRFEGGLKKVRYHRALTEAARAKICIDLPGNGDFCYRLMDYLAVGAFVVAYPHKTALPEPLVDGKHLVYMREDLSDLVPLCEYYLHHEDERRRIQQNCRDYFDRYVDSTQLGGWYLRQLAERLTRVVAVAAAG